MYQLLGFWRMAEATTVAEGVAIGALSVSAIAAVLSWVAFVYSRKATKAAGHVESMGRVYAGYSELRIYESITGRNPTSLNSPVTMTALLRGYAPRLVRSHPDATKSDASASAQ
jgi:hypothetical protein